MPRFTPINRFEELPLPSSVDARERYVLDFKEPIDTTHWWELAKDVAAFANALGGVLLIGVEEGPPPVYTGLPTALAAKIQLAYEDATKDHLSPRPIVDPVVIHFPDGERAIVAVNVYPYPDQPIGARLSKANKNGVAVADNNAWQFPYRVGRHTRFLEPAMIPMLTNSVVRRTVILLESIPHADQANVIDPKIVWRNPRNQMNAEPTLSSVQIESVEPEKNVLILRLRTTLPGHPDSLIRVPLDDVEAVWEVREGEWHIRVSGCITTQPAQYITNPRGAVFKT